MTKRTGINEMWNRLDKKERLHFKTRYLVDLCECAREDGRREGRLEAYKDVQKWIDKMDMPYDDFDYGLFNRFLERRKKELM